MALILSAVTASSAQEGATLLSVDTNLADFGVADVASIGLGRISVVDGPEGPALTLQLLHEGSPRRPAAPGGAVEPEAPALEPPTGDATIRRGLRALWVWSTAEILADEAERAAFLDFVQREAIDRVFLYMAVEDGRSPDAGFLPFDSQALGPLLADLRARGALAYGLDGDPDYIHRENHEGVLRTVRRVAEHNRSSPPEERFLGVRYDVEPYLVRGFQGPRREAILNDYVALLAAAADEARANGLAFGADVPFWFDGVDEITGESFEAVLDGERRSVLDHVMARVDDVAIMAYRTSASGPDGAVTHAAGEVLEGNASDTGVFVGVETTRLLDERLYTFRGPGRAGLPTLPDAPWVVLESLGDGDARVWMVEGDSALDALADRTADAESLRYWFAGQPVTLPADRLSFYDLGARPMRAVSEQIVEQLAGQESFLGLAFHDYRGMRRLVAPTP